MRRLTLLLTMMAALAGPATAEAYPCYKNGKTIRADQCALLNMNEYAAWAYWQPTLQTFWVKPSSVGKFHARYRAHVQTGGPDAGLLVPRRVRLSAKRCGNAFTVFDHRKGQWSIAC